MKYFFELDDTKPDDFAYLALVALHEGTIEDVIKKWKDELGINVVKYQQAPDNADLKGHPNRKTLKLADVI